MSHAPCLAASNCRLDTVRTVGLTCQCLMMPRTIDALESYARNGRPDDKARRDGGGRRPSPGGTPGHSGHGMWRPPVCSRFLAIEGVRGSPRCISQHAVRVGGTAAFGDRVVEAWQARGTPGDEDPWTYHERWLAAMQSVLSGSGLLSDANIDKRNQAQVTPSPDRHRRKPSAGPVTIDKAQPTTVRNIIDRKDQP